MTRRTSLFFFSFFFFWGGCSFAPGKGAKNGLLGGRLDFFRPLAHAGGCTHTKKKKRSSTQKMTKISKTSSLLALDTAKGPCNHNRLYLCVGGRHYSRRTFFYSVPGYILPTRTKTAFKPWVILHASYIHMNNHTPDFHSYHTAVTLLSYFDFVALNNEHSWWGDIKRVRIVGTMEVSVSSAQKYISYGLGCGLVINKFNLISQMGRVGLWFGLSLIS